MRSSSTDRSIPAIERASKKVAIVASDVLLQEVTAGNLEAAAAEIEDYLRPLRDQSMPEELKSAHAALVEDFDELIVAIRAYDTEQIAETSLSIAKTAVDVEVVCA